MPALVRFALVLTVVLSALGDAVRADPIDDARAALAADDPCGAVQALEDGEGLGYSEPALLERARDRCETVRQREAAQAGERAAERESERAAELARRRRNVDAARANPTCSICAAALVVRGGRLQIDTRGVLNFEPGSAELTRDGYFVTEILAQLLACGPAVERVLIEGHSDNDGDHGRNLLLTQRRAEAVVEDLVALGIAPGRLEAVGYGPDRPIADNSTAEGRAANRRVEVILRDVGGQHDVHAENDEDLAVLRTALGCSVH